MRTHVRCRSTTTTRAANDKKSGISLGNIEHLVDEEGWVHLYDVGAFELRKLAGAFAEVEVADWGDMGRMEYAKERDEMAAILEKKKAMR